MNQPMNIFSFNDFESTFKILNLDMTQAEFSGLMEEYGYSKIRSSNIFGRKRSAIPSKCISGPADFL